MSSTASYQTEIHKALMGSNEITVIELTPVFSTEENMVKNKLNIEQNLYQIFERYAHS